MNEIKVTVELSEKAENLLTAILHELCRLPSGEITIHDERPQAQEAETTTEPAQIAEEPQEVETVPAEPQEVETVPAEPEEPKNEPTEAETEAPRQTYELGDVLAKVQSLIKAGKKNECRDIVQAFAPSVSTIPVDKFGEVMERLAALEG
jgi:outer membrane biosynthesis protein TonB